MEIGFLNRFEIESFRRRKKTWNFGRLLFKSECFGDVRFVIIRPGTVGGLFGFIIGIERYHGVKVREAFNR